MPAKAERIDLRALHPGAISKRVRKAVREASETERWTPSADVLGAIAVRTADLADAAGRAGDARLMASAIHDLLRILERLPLDEPPAPGLVAGTTRERAADDPRAAAAAELEGLMGAAPTVGDSEATRPTVLRAAGGEDR